MARGRAHPVISGLALDLRRCRSGPFSMSAVPTCAMSICALPVCDPRMPRGPGAGSEPRAVTPDRVRRSRCHADAEERARRARRGSARQGRPSSSHIRHMYSLVSRSSVIASSIALMVSRECSHLRRRQRGHGAVEHRRALGEHLERHGLAVRGERQQLGTAVVRRDALDQTVLLEPVDELDGARVGDPQPRRRGRRWGGPGTRAG